MYHLFQLSTLERFYGCEHCCITGSVPWWGRGFQQEIVETVEILTLALTILASGKAACA